MAPLKRKRSQRLRNQDTAPAAPEPEAKGPPGHRRLGAPNKTRSTIDRRATRQSSSVAPDLPPWAADPEPRRRRAKLINKSTQGPKPELVGQEQEDENTAPPPAAAAAAATAKKPSLRSTSSNQAVPRSAPTPVPVPAVPVPAARGRGRPSAQQQKPRPVLGSTNQANPALVSKSRGGGGGGGVRAASRQHNGVEIVVEKQPRHDDGDENDRRRSSVTTNGLVAPMQTEAAAPVPSLKRRRRSSAAVGPPPVASPLLPPSSTSTSTRPTTTIQKHHQQQQLPAATIPSVPIMKTQAQQRTPRIFDHITANTSKPVVPATTTSTQQQPPPLPPKPAKKPRPGKQPELRRSSVIERNIEKVVFGNICFSTWYHSPYGTEALGEISGNGLKASGVQDGGSNKDDGLANAASKKSKEEKLDRLYVCPCCFKYSKELVPWWQHVHLCERRGHVPGEKIYTHPKRTQPTPIPNSMMESAVPAGSKAPGRKRKHSSGEAHEQQAAGNYEGEWSIWQVDGEDEGLFCQNLSLFAKLFLDNKSVFFDVGGFNYFLLVHSTPRQPAPDDTSGDPLPPKRQIVGFFSKEKLSWDNNNLACILVFPPWQRKGLGALLMGVSYEISRREGMLGGPEKPISDLGRKGYKRFWAGEIAAWLLSLDTNGEEECVVDVDECSKATWIVPEDCLMILRDMGVAEEAEDGPPPKKRKNIVLPPIEENEQGGEEEEDMVNSMEEEVKDVRRVRIGKDAVWAWVQANRIRLEKPCDPDGFVEGYAIKEPAVEEEEL